MKQCAKGHPMDDAHKRCSECGDEAATPSDKGAEMAKAVCGDCGSEGLETQKFCSDCGEPMLKAEQVEADLTAALDELDVVAKANTALSDKIELPAAGDDDDAEMAELLKADGDGNIDALPILEAIRISQNRVAATNVQAATETRATRREIGVMMKAYITRERHRDRQHKAELTLLKAQIAGLEGKITELANTSRGHRSRLTIAEIEKPLGTEKPGGEAVTMNRDVFMAKAHVAFDQKKLTYEEIANVETWVNQGPNGLAAMNEADPALYAKCVSAINAVTQ